MGEGVWGSGDRRGRHWPTVAGVSDSVTRTQASSCESRPPEALGPRVARKRPCVGRARAGPGRGLGTRRTRGPRGAAPSARRAADAPGAARVRGQVRAAPQPRLPRAQAQEAEGDGGLGAPRDCVPSAPGAPLHPPPQGRSKDRASRRLRPRPSRPQTTGRIRGNRGDADGVPTAQAPRTERGRGPRCGREGPSEWGRGRGRVRAPPTRAAASRRPAAKAAGSG